jgi:hypothetical protein
VIEGELKCKKCGSKFYIRNGIACFMSCNKKQFEREAKKLRKVTREQEIPKRWMRFYSKPELIALKKEWSFLLSVVKKINPPFILILPLVPEGFSEILFQKQKEK